MEPNRKKPMKSRAMDDRIWKEFPKDLLEEEVIARLPADAIYRLRLVCRRWNSLLGSQTSPWVFSRTYGYTKGKTPKTGVMYNPCRKKWRSHPICTRYMFPSASAGGLVCCIDMSRESFVVGNPVTGTWKEFPRGCLQNNYNAAIGMVLSPGGGYKVVVVTHQGNFEVYDSSVSTTGGTIPANTKLKIACSCPYWPEQEFCGPTVTIGTVVYMMISNPNGVLSYDVATGVWEVLHVLDPPKSRDLALGSCGGRVLLMGLVMGENAASFAVCVWELFRTSTMPAVWTEIDRIPSSWYNLKTWKNVSLGCIGNTRLLMMRLLTTRADWVFTYDAVSREWSRVPYNCFVVPGHKAHLYPHAGVSFFPSLFF